MAETVKQTEAIPAAYPTVTQVNRGYDFNDPLQLDFNLDPVWQRIEAYVAHRWTPREVIWIVEGEGEWMPPLTPATVTASEVWENGAWSTVTLSPGAYGYDLTGDGPYRITATVGGGDLPEAVEEAVWRLAEYNRGITEQFKNDAAYRQDGEIEVAPNWTARAIQLSGAADLLRPYRRA